MKISIMMLSFLLTAISCSDNDSSEKDLKDPATVHPPSEAIPDSTAIVNDSAIIPDTNKNQ